ncbi:hypothetical protein OMAG_000996 [Candidatus Omnitrophus magneticus]|uniref:Uncharacterized protein n=1 Tax=Candidatus Omnitrophus magneticus TaxID=1609969 RepID=A0A0F0CPD6_9BACT|nr:hypothetical protein OMAG_000996 [Candidatus Omnitrophus magneticus]
MRATYRHLRRLCLRDRVNYYKKGGNYGVMGEKGGKLRGKQFLKVDKNSGRMREKL